MTDTQLYSSGDIARILGVKVQAVRHILHTRTHIVPLARLGIVRCYGRSALDAVAQELRNQEAASTTAI